MPDTTALPHETESSESPEKFPLKSGVIVFRVICVLIAIWAYWEGYRAEQPPMFVLTWHYAAYVGVPSLLIAIGLCLRQRWGAWAAVAFDLIAYPILLGVRTFQMIGYGDGQLLVISLGAFWVEAAVLLYALKPKRTAIIACITSAFVFLGVGVGVERVPHYQTLHRVAPLMRWIDKHWIAMPSSLVYWDLDLLEGRNSRDGGAALLADRYGSVPHHPDHIIVNYRTDRTGAPLLPKRGQFGLSVYVIYDQYYGWNDVRSRTLKPAQVIRMLRRYGAPDDLHFLGICDGPEPKDSYRFHSTRADAYYRTNNYRDYSLYVDIRHHQ